MGLTLLGSLSLMAIEPDIFVLISYYEAIDYFLLMKSQKFLYFDMYEYNQLVEKITKQFLYLILIKLIIITI